MRFLLLFALGSLLNAAEHSIKPGDNPQTVLDRTAPGDKLVFLPGLHQHGLTKHRSMLYVDKSIHIELSEGATLKLADETTKLEAEPEITTDQDAGKKLDDLEIGGRFDLIKPCIFSIKIDSEGSDGGADTFAWGVFESADNPREVPIYRHPPTSSPRRRISRCR